LKSRSAVEEVKIQCLVVVVVVVLGAASKKTRVRREMII